MLWTFIRWLFANHWPVFVLGATAGVLLGTAVLVIAGTASTVIGLGLAALFGVDATPLEALGIGAAFLILAHVIATLLR